MNKSIVVVVVFNYFNWFNKQIALHCFKLLLIKCKQISLNWIYQSKKHTKYVAPNPIKRCNCTYILIWSISLPVQKIYIFHVLNSKGNISQKFINLTNKKHTTNQNQFEFVFVLIYFGDKRMRRGNEL